MPDNSMRGAGIIEKAHVLIQLKVTAQSGDIVLTKIENKTYLRRLIIKNNVFILKAENTDYESFIYVKENDFEILGKAIEVKTTYLKAKNTLLFNNSLNRTYSSTGTAHLIQSFVLITCLSFTLPSIQDTGQFLEHLVQPIHLSVIKYSSKALHVPAGQVLLSSLTWASYSFLKYFNVDNTGIRCCLS